MDVGETYHNELLFSYEVKRISQNIFVAVVWGYPKGAPAPTEDLAVANAFIEVAQGMLTDASNKAQDGTRQIAGDKVTSEELRDQYLGPESPTK